MRGRSTDFSSSAPNALLLPDFLLPVGKGSLGNHSDVLFCIISPPLPSSPQNWINKLFYLNKHNPQCSAAFRSKSCGGYQIYCAKALFLKGTEWQGRELCYESTHSSDRARWRTGARKPWAQVWGSAMNRCSPTAWGRPGTWTLFGSMQMEMEAVTSCVLKFCGYMVQILWDSGYRALLSEAVVLHRRKGLFPAN